MQINGTSEWSNQTPNGGCNFKRPPLSQCLGPSPAAVTFLQKELGHFTPLAVTPQPQTQPVPTPHPAAPSSFSSNRFISSPPVPDAANRMAPRADGSGFEMTDLQRQGSQPEIRPGAVDDSHSQEFQQVLAIRALADLFTCPESSFPLSVGIFKDNSNANVAPGLRHLTLVQLQDELEKLVRHNARALSTFSPALIVAPALVIFITAFLLGILTKFQFGLSIGILGLYIQFLILVAVPIGKSFFNFRIAWSASLVLSSFVRQINLFTKFLFFNPRRKISCFSPVNIVTVHYRLSESQNTPHLILMLLKRMWSAMDEHYNPLVVRLQRFMHTNAYPVSMKRNHKRICCLPAYVVVALVGLASIIDLLLLRIFSFNAIAMLTDLRVLPIFVVMSSIIFLGVCASVPSVASALFTLIYRPKTSLEKAIESYESSGGVGTNSPKKSKIIHTIASSLNLSKMPLNSNGTCLPSLEAANVLPVTSSCEVNILAKKEFANVCDMLQAFNFYLEKVEHTRMVVIIDATDASSPVQLAGVLYQVHSLMLTQPNAPVAFVIATDIKIFLGKPELSYSNIRGPVTSSEATEARNLIQGVADSNHLVLFNIHLPIFLEANGSGESTEETFVKLQGADRLQILLQRPPDITTPEKSKPRTPSTCNSEGRNFSSSSHIIGFRIGDDDLPLSVQPKYSLSGQDNKAFISVEELRTPQAGLNNMKTVQSTTSLVAASNKTGLAPSEVVTTVNSSRLTSTKAEAKGIAEIFLANKEMAEQNVPVIRTLVAETAFTSRLQKLTCSTISIRQLVNWVYMTQHWPYHTAWLIAMLEDVSSTDNSAPASTGMSELIVTALNEIATVPPVVSILSGDDRDPEKLLNFSQTQLDCDYSAADIKCLVNTSLFLNPFVRACIKGIRQSYFGETKPHNLPGVRDANLSGSSGALEDAKPPKVSGVFRVSAPPPLQLPAAIDSDFSRVRGSLGPRVQQNNSSEYAKNHVPVAFDYDHLEKSLCFANPANVSVVQPCPIRLRSNIPMEVLSKMSVDDICTVLSIISDIPAGNCASYQMQIRRQNISGQVLSVCDLDKLRSELQMSFGDWQLFNTCILYLREIETNINESSRSRRSRSACDSKSPTGSAGISPTFHYPQILVPQSQFVLCKDQPQLRGKNMFDVPVLVQQVSRESATHYNRQNADRTTSDFSFGSGTDEMELVWHRDDQLNSIRGPQEHPAPQLSAIAKGSNRVCPTAPPIACGLSKSSYDLRPSLSTHQRSDGNAHGDGRRLVGRAKQRLSAVQIPTNQPSSSATSDQKFQMLPAYIPKGTEASGFIPLWCPTLSCVGEVRQPQSHPSQKGHSESSGSSESSVSFDGTYDFPSDYPSGAHQHGYTARQCPATCPHHHHNRQRRRRRQRRISRSRKSPRHCSSRKNSEGRCSQKGAEGCTCELLLYDKERGGGRDRNGNPWTSRSPHKLSSPDLSEIEGMTSS